MYTSLNNYPVSQNVLPVNGDLPLFLHCEIPSYYSPDISDFSDCELIIWDDFQLDKDESWKLEGETREQADCDIWIQERKNRVTASRIFGVWSWKRGFEKHAKTFTSDLGPLSTFIKRKFDYGHMYESVAW